MVSRKLVLMGMWLVIVLLGMKSQAMSQALPPAGMGADFNFSGWNSKDGEGSTISGIPNVTTDFSRLCGLRQVQFAIPTAGRTDTAGPANFSIGRAQGEGVTAVNMVFRDSSYAVYNVAFNWRIDTSDGVNYFPNPLLSSSISYNITAPRLMATKPEISVVSASVISANIPVNTPYPPVDYIWYRDGRQVAVTSVNSLSIAVTGAYTVVARYPGGCLSPASEAVTLVTTSTAEMASKMGVKIFPQPAHDLLHIQVPDDLASQVSTIEVYSIAGNRVFDYAWAIGQRSQQLALPSNLPAGNYQLCIKSEKSVIVQRLVIQ